MTITRRSTLAGFAAGALFSSLPLAARAEIAVALGEVQLAHTLRAELGRVQLSDSEREELREELAAADKLERSQS